MSSTGLLALVGAGEYLPVMAELEATLLKAGQSKRFVQLATAAGQESGERLMFWQGRGGEQAERIGAEQIFIPV